MKINPTSFTVSQMLGTQNEQYVIPAYQRRFSWRYRQVAELWDDIDVLGSADTHLLGTIVCLTGHFTAAINRLELVDGQQRLTTISIILHCLLNRLKKEGEATEAQDLERLLRAKPAKGDQQPKIALDSLDAKQFERHASGLVVDLIENERLAEAFKDVAEWVGKLDLEGVMDFVYKLLNQAMIIRLDVSDAKDAFKLFETINSRGLRLSSTDVIKNFMLGNAARFGTSSLTIAQDKWTELIRNLDGIWMDAFFRQFMSSSLGTPVTKSMVVSEFQWAFMKDVQEAKSLPDRKRYYDVPEDEDDEEEEEKLPVDRDDEESDPEEGEEANSSSTPTVPFDEFLNQLVDRAKTYREIVLGETGNPKLDRRLRNLRLINAQPSYGFLMTLRGGGCSDKQLEEVLQLTEAFLLRRHICRERTNENERVFARLSSAKPTDPLDDVRKTFREYSPSDEKFREEFATAKFISPLIPRARYCLEQIEMHLQGKYPELIPGGAEDVHVEHIIPQKIKTKKAKTKFGDWPTYLGNGAEERHPRYVSRIGNLTIFAGELNIGASNNPYARKKAAYKCSAIKLTKGLLVEYPSFRFAQVEKRSKKLADLAVKLWPIA